MTLVLDGKSLLLEGSNPKIEDKQVPGIYIVSASDFLLTQPLILKHNPSALFFAPVLANFRELRDIFVSIFIDY